jgi:4-amino-4-deoxy-L-arabinose transferase-like glycosyltransferase
VTQTDNSNRDGDTLSMTGRILCLTLIIATLYLCYFHNLGAIGLVGPDEPRYAWIAREMHESGDWVTPRLYGKPWFEKPVLLYWGAALSFKLFGVTGAAARFPSAFAALLATLAMAWLAWRVYGPWTARWLLLLLPTTVGMIGFSHAAATDMPFAAALTVALVFAAIILGLTREQDSPPSRRTPWLALILFGFFLGLAMLAKGPAAIVLPGGGVLLWAAFTRRWRDAFRCLHPVAIASFCLTALPWYIVCSRRNPDFFHIFIIEHNFKRYLTPEFQHIQPFWFYAPVLLVAFAPWTLALVWSALFGAFRAWPQRRPSDATLLALCWAIFCLVFFSISKSKLPGYILPAVPPIALLLSRAYVRLVPQDGWTFRFLLLTGVILNILVAALVWSIPFHASRINARAATGAGWVLLLFGVANSLFSSKRNFISGSQEGTASAVPNGSESSGVLTPEVRRSDSRSIHESGSGTTATLRPFPLAPLCVVPILVLLLFFNHLAPLFLRYDPSGRTLAQELRAANIPPEQTYVAHMQRGQLFSLSFYLHQEIQTWDQNQPKEGYLLRNFRDCRHFVKPPWLCATDPLELQTSGWFVYKVQRDDSVSNRADGGTLGDHHLGGGLYQDGLDARDRQPR